MSQVGIDGKEVVGNHTQQHIDRLNMQNILRIINKDDCKNRNDTSTWNLKKHKHARHKIWVNKEWTAEERHRHTTRLSKICICKQIVDTNIGWFKERLVDAKNNELFVKISDLRKEMCKINVHVEKWTDESIRFKLKKAFLDCGISEVKVMRRGDEFTLYLKA